MSRPLRIPPLRTSIVAALALVFTYFFFIEYLSPFRKVHIPFDLEGYHYPLADFAFQELKHGRFPEWDSSIYCGQTFVGNVQAALFYPATWLLFAVNLGREHVSYQSLQVFAIAHVWLAFLLCFIWLRGKRLEDLASILGAGVYAFSGYVLLQLQHMGLICAYAWFPFGLWGIDQAVEAKSWRPLWKVMVASALCFLAGYPPTWFVFAVFTGTYALFSRWHWKAAAGTTIALGASFLLSMVQLLPALEANARKVPELRYGIGIRDPLFYLSYLVPNYFNFGRDVPVPTNPGKEYLYLGAPAFLGLIWLLILVTRRRNPRDVVPILAAGTISAIILTNPFNLVWLVIQHSLLISEVCRDWYFLAAITLAVAPLAAYGLDTFLRREAKPVRRWLVWLSGALLAGWAGWELARWLPGGRGFAFGARAVIDPAITLSIIALVLYVLRAQKGTARVYLTIALLAGVGVDYKVFGTSMRLNGTPGSGQPSFTSLSFAMDSDAYRQMRANPEYRILLDSSAPSALELRHYGLASPQGFDPFITTQLKQLIEGHGGRFRTNWEFDVGPDKDTLLKLLGVRYVVTSGDGLMAEYRASSSFQLIGRDDKYFKVFEYRSAQPSYGWVDRNGVNDRGVNRNDGNRSDRDNDGSDAGSVERITWNPAQRAFVVRSTAGGRFGLKEQFFPGWSATLDGHAVPEEQWEGAFQAVQVPPGEHQLQFQFRSSGLRTGAWVSAVSWVALGLYLWFTKPSRHVARRSLDSAANSNERSD